MTDAEVIAELQAGNRLLKQERYKFLGKIEKLEEQIKELEADIAKRPAKPLFGESRSLLLKAMDNSAYVDDAIEKYNGLKKRIAELETKNKLQAEHIELLKKCNDSSIEVISKMDTEIEQLQKQIDVYKNCSKDHEEKCPDVKCWVQVLRDKQMDEIEQLINQIKELSGYSCEK